MTDALKLGSLFDGSGTAPLAAAMCGIEPVRGNGMALPNVLHVMKGIAKQCGEGLIG